MLILSVMQYIQLCTVLVLIYLVKIILNRIEQFPISFLHRLLSQAQNCLYGNIRLHSLPLASAPSKCVGENQSLYEKFLPSTFTYHFYIHIYMCMYRAFNEYIKSIFQ